MKILVPVTIKLPVGVLLYFANLAEKTDMKAQNAMSAILTGFAECQIDGTMQSLDAVPFIAVDTHPIPHQNN